MRASFYQWMILQEGQLPLLPDGRVLPLAEHVCSVILIWPIDEKPQPSNSLIVDPCFSARGYRLAKHKLSQIGASLLDIGFFFVTHGHSDHVLHCPDYDVSSAWQAFDPGTEGVFSGIHSKACPGHHPDLLSLHFASDKGETWVVSDAILNVTWLHAWKYYWPNGYHREEIIQTWQSIALILSQAQVAIPGHGKEIRVTDSLLEKLIANFSCVADAAECSDVIESLNQRRLALKRDAKANDAIDSL